MTVTRTNPYVPEATIEQDADAFFKEMAEPAVIICPFRIDTREHANEGFDIWHKHGWLTDEALAALKERPLPIEYGDPLPSGHTKGYMLMKRGRIGINDLDVQGMKQAADEHEEATK